MKKAALLTIHVGFNFGSVLQTIASCRALEKCGLITEVVNYCPNRVTYRNYFKIALSSPKKFVWRMLLLPIFALNKKIYGRYLRRHVNLSKPIYDRDNFAVKCPQANIYVSGSDQIWNSIHNEGFNSRYLFEGVSSNASKISYASSIGRAELPSDEKQLLRKFLTDYKSVSVREKSGVDILSEISISATQLLDPTFVLSSEEWKTYMNKRIMKSPYILIYTPYNTVDKNIIYDSARLLAKKNNLKVVTFSWRLGFEPKADKTIHFADPGDFLSLMYNADYVITNSFHGTAFSINLNKQFWVFQPSAFSTRIHSILELTNLSHRLLTEPLKPSDITKIDYNPVNSILERERQRSIDFLKKAIE